MCHKKKVLFCTTGRVGGAEKMVITISKLLDPEKYDICYVVIDQQVQEIANFFPENARVIHLKIRNSWDFLTLKLLWIIKKEHADYIFSSLAPINVRVIVAGKIAGIKPIVRSNNNWAFFSRFYQFLMKLTYPKAYKVIMQQEDMYADYINEIPQCKDNMITLHNIPDYATIDKNKVEQSPYITDNEIRYVWMGRIIYTKGFDVILRAFNKVSQKINNAHLYLLGKINESDEYYNSLIKYVNSHNLSEKVHFVGLQKNPHKWIANADCFVLPSRVEGLPNSLIEAMYIGKPVVSTLCLPIIKRMVKDGYNGYTVNVDDHEELANAMVKALELKNFTMIYKSSKAEDFIRLFE